MLNRFRSLVLASGIFLLLVIGTAFSQQANDSPSAFPDVCTAEYFFDADREFRSRKFGRGASQPVKRKFEAILDQCPTSPYQTDIKERLRALLEESSDHNLYIARYYLRKFEDGRSGLSGAISRLKSIFESNPEYSKIDEVLYLLGYSYFLQEEFVESRKTFQKLIDDHSESIFAEKAKIWLEQIRANERDQKKGGLREQTIRQPLKQS